MRLLCQYPINTQLRKVVFAECFVCLCVLVVSIFFKVNGSKKLILYYVILIDIEVHAVQLFSRRSVVTPLLLLVAICNYKTLYKNTVSVIEENNEKK